MPEKIPQPKGRDELFDDYADEESAAREKVYDKQLTPQKYLAILDKIVSLGRLAEAEEKGSPHALENAFAYYKEAYERLKDLSVACPDELFSRKLLELKDKIDNLLAGAKSADQELGETLQRQFDWVLFAEQTKIFSPEKMKEIQELISKVRHLIGWDLGAMCKTSEEVDVVNAAKEAMAEIGNVFKVPPEPDWFEPKKTAETPVKSGWFLPGITSLKIQEDLAKIEEILKWDIDSICHEGTDQKILKEAEQAFQKLKEIL